MIYSLTPFFRELDILEIRLGTLDSVVDRHVITEARVTHQGEPKPLYIEEHWERFAPWHDKITYVVVEDMPEGDDVRGGPHRETEACQSDNWAREKHQRQALERGLPPLDEDDILLLCDLDEIPNPECFNEGIALARAGCIARPRLAMHVYRLRWRWAEALPVIARFFTPKRLAEHENVAWPMGDRTMHGGLEAVRLQEGRPYGSHVAPGLGWHLSYMGGVEAVQAKLAGAAHHELNVSKFNGEKHIKHSIEQGADIFDRDYREATYCPHDELPPYVLENRDRFKELL